MNTRSKIVFRFHIEGNGRQEVISNQPLTTNADFSIVTDGAANLNSPHMFNQIVLEPGWNQVIDSLAYTVNPMARDYLAIIPPGATVGGPCGITWPLVLGGSTLDLGVYMTPGQPLFLAMPPGIVQMYLCNTGPVAMTCDQWIF